MTTQTSYKNGEYESTAAYIWDSDTLVERRIYDKNDPESYTSSRIIYDADGEPQALVVTSGKNGIFNDEVGELVLYYRRNLQGDITGLVDSSGKPWGEFIYDAFGNFTFETETEGIGAVFEMLVSFVLTPISYRGYVYTSLDSKHCYYYLGSRFYSPLLSRFMNADSMADTGTGVVGTNMFAYCNNSPVGFIDPDGEQSIGNKILGIPLRVVFSFFRYLQNMQKMKEYKGIIEDQYDEPIASLRYGLTRMRDTGCELIAIYNAMLLYGKNPFLPNIIFTAENSVPGMVLEGGLGTDPVFEKNYLKKQGINTKTYSTIKEADADKKEGDIFIITFSNRFGKRNQFYSVKVHTVAVVVRSFGIIRAYNAGAKIYDSLYLLAKEADGWLTLKCYKLL
mgnify:CR=1 FL=1